MADPFREIRLTKLGLWSPLAPMILALAALVFGLDQTYKWWMLGAYDIAARQPVAITPFFELVLVWNKGISYGLFRSHEQGVLIALSLVITVVLWVWACRLRERAATGQRSIMFPLSPMTSPAALRTPARPSFPASRSSVCRSIAPDARG
jgi:hypothetical protein